MVVRSQRGPERRPVESRSSGTPHSCTLRALVLRALAFVVGPLARFGRDDGVRRRRGRRRGRCPRPNPEGSPSVCNHGNSDDEWVTNNATTSSRGSNGADPRAMRRPAVVVALMRSRGHPSEDARDTWAVTRVGRTHVTKELTGLPRDPRDFWIRPGAFQNGL